MNQHLVSIFSIVKNEKVYQLMVGNCTVDEVLDVLEDFKKDFQDFKKNLEERAQQEAAAKEVADAEAKKEDVALEPEMINEVQ
jgi:hypothetical protein